jgi:antirestriction protein ArdC
MSTAYEIVTESIIKQLESGVAPWRKPWRTLIPANLVSKKEYRGINIFLLAAQGYGSRYWVTYRQAQALGGTVRKGQHGSRVVFWKIGEYRRENQETEETENHKSILLRDYTVFNLEQCEGITSPDPVREIHPLEQCESIVRSMPNPPGLAQDARACYWPSTDTVGMPARSAFHSAEEYYSALFHEITHSTGHPSRVGREGIMNHNPFGSEYYSNEELIAEMGAAMLCGVAGIESQTLDNSVAYLQTWINKLKSDSRLIVSAASQAQKAADYILGKAAAETDSATKGENELETLQLQITAEPLPTEVELPGHSNPEIPRKGTRDKPSRNSHADQESPSQPSQARSHDRSHAPGDARPAQGRAETLDTRVGHDPAGVPARPAGL